MRETRPGGGLGLLERWTGRIPPRAGFIMAGACLLATATVALWCASMNVGDAHGIIAIATLVAGTIVVGVLGVLSHARTLSLISARQAYLDELEQLVRRDELSGLYNFRYVRDWMARTVGGGERCALILIDIDNFKEINDRYGHAIGDELLSGIGRAIEARLASDGGLAARYGGDEFAIVLPEHDRAGAERLADEVRRDIIAATHTAARVSTHVKLDACVGIAVYPEDAGDLDTLIVTAHRALDDAKLHNSASGERLSERHAQEVFFAIGEAMGKSLDPQALVTNLVNAVGTRLELDTCTLWLFEDGRLRPRASFLIDPAVPAAFGEIHSAAPMTLDEAVATGFLADDAVYVDDVLSSDVLPQRYHRLVRPNTWMIVVPLHGEREGALTITGVHERIAAPSLSLARAIGRLAASALQNADMYQRAIRHQEQLSALSGIAGLLFDEGPFEERLGATVERIGEITGTDMLSLDTDDPTGERPFLREFYISERARPLLDPAVLELWMNTRPQITDDGVREFLADLREPLVLNDPASEVTDVYREVVLKSGTRMVVVVPAVWQCELKGILYFTSFRANAYDTHDIALMKSIAAQLAPALQVAVLRAEIEHSYGELKAAHTQALLRLAYAAEARDPYTECHLTRIKALSQAIATRIGIADEELEAIGYGAIVHDLGKLRIPDSILCNPGSLSDDEWKTMKRHPEWGAEIIGENSFYDVARQVALSHHERWDGSGYPRGLKGDEIPLAARIVAVADVYDALTSARPYKHAWPVERALVELMRMRGKTLCPQSVDVFMQLWNEGVVSRIDEETLDESLEQDFRSLFAA